MSRKTVMVVTYAQVALAIPLLFLITPQRPQFAYLFGIVFGFAMGADYMLIPLMAADVFGLRTLARAMSAIVPADTITQYSVAQPDRPTARRVGRRRQRALGRTGSRRRRNCDRALASRGDRSGHARRGHAASRADSVLNSTTLVPEFRQRCNRNSTVTSWSAATAWGTVTLPKQR
jgi:hypothetical protein